MSQASGRSSVAWFWFKVSHEIVIEVLVKTSHPRIDWVGGSASKLIPVAVDRTPQFLTSHCPQLLFTCGRLHKGV